MRSFKQWSDMFTGNMFLGRINWNRDIEFRET